MNYIISSKTADAINTFYHNVAKKYKHTYSLELMLKNLTNAYGAIYQIENGLIRRRPTISRWNGLYMATSTDRKWNFAYRIEGESIYVEDACHAQNMHESLKILRFTESQFKMFLSECILKYLTNIV